MRCGRVVAAVENSIASPHGVHNQEDSVPTRAPHQEARLPITLCLVCYATDFFAASSALFWCSGCSRRSAKPAARCDRRPANVRLHAQHRANRPADATFAVGPICVTRHTLRQNAGRRATAKTLHPYRRIAPGREKRPLNEGEPYRILVNHSASWRREQPVRPVIVGKCRHLAPQC